MFSRHPSSTLMIPLVLINLVLSSDLDFARTCVRCGQTKKKACTGQEKPRDCGRSAHGRVPNGCTKTTDANGWITMDCIQGYKSMRSEWSKEGCTKHPRGVTKCVCRNATCDFDGLPTTIAVETVEETTLTMARNLDIAEPPPTIDIKNCIRCGQSKKKACTHNDKPRDCGKTFAGRVVNGCTKTTEANGWIIMDCVQGYLKKKQDWSKEGCTKYSTGVIKCICRSETCDFDSLPTTFISVESIPEASVVEETTVTIARNLELAELISATNKDIRNCVRCGQSKKKPCTINDKPRDCGKMSAGRVVNGCTKTTDPAGWITMDCVQGYKFKKPELAKEECTKYPRGIMKCVCRTEGCNFDNLPINDASIGETTEVSETLESTTLALLITLTTTESTTTIPTTTYTTTTPTTTTPITTTPTTTTPTTTTPTTTTPTTTTSTTTTPRTTTPTTTTTTTPTTTTPTTTTPTTTTPTTTTPTTTTLTTTTPTTTTPLTTTATTTTSTTTTPTTPTTTTLSTPTTTTPSTPTTTTPTATNTEDPIDFIELNQGRAFEEPTTDEKVPVKIIKASEAIESTPQPSKNPTVVVLVTIPPTQLILTQKQRDRIERVKLIKRYQKLIRPLLH